MKNDFQFKVYDGNVWDNLLVQWLEFDYHMIYKLNDHRDLRKGFFNKLLKLFDAALQTHLTLPTPCTAVWSWNSKNAELEFSELFFVLHILTQKINICDSKCSPSKARKILFNSLGLDDKDYKKKLKQIKQRKKGEHFLNQLSKNLNDYVGGLLTPRKIDSRAKL